jgi:hypothetical protein
LQYEHRRGNPAPVPIMTFVLLADISKLRNDRFSYRSFAFLAVAYIAEKNAHKPP